MPWTSRIDQRARVIYTRVSGVLSASDAAAHRDTLAADPDFDPTYRHVLDLRAVDQFELTHDDVRALGSDSILTAPGQQAIIVATDALFGICRMYYAYATARPGHEDIHVCRTVYDACDRLKLDELPGCQDR